ncbi:ABC transporter permease [Acholeplasma hippikon]|uniref:Polyamine (Spermidine/putrescine) ABC transporter permease n=1 Tax=Acholeplasma hippikon TaxID=264636 RepID=A0A449BIB0_9MOLU|nr:ABC transporter permease [Acholeplasma hippikon]VEU82172.1 polyamine (spermidine/putrescine) ABC transporter permease [Acholeplasma hippikon]
MDNTLKTQNVKKKKISFNSFLGIPYYLVLAILVILPLFIMLLYAFTSNNSSIFNIQFTLNNFIKFFSTRDYVGIMFESIWLAIRSTFICLLICYPLAYFISKLPKRTQTILVLLFTSTMWINSLILMHSLKNVFLIAASFVVGGNAEYSQLTIFLGHDYSIIIGTIFLYMPYMFLPIYTQMTKIDKNLLEGAADLGANKFQTLVRVVFPLTLSSVISSCLVVLLPATTTLVVSEIMGNGQRPLIGNLIERQTGSRFGEMAAYSIILAVAMLIIVAILKSMDRYEEVLSNE